MLVVKNASQQLTDFYHIAEHSGSCSWLLQKIINEPLQKK